ncbi:MAG: hypothetical protein CVU61_15275 [Deltaproteobacteria bacterium HGW-Deltaproteobacteria-19]|jgi:hypothetical protein|nr:MAG: hypothetical protein CVU61_15275 [Deltaproteobacteria bacterium HGW-Deltaproteobacteria-19]
MNPARFQRIMHCFSILLAPAIVLLMLWPAAATGTDFYQWTDENGVLQISNMPPEETPKKQRRVKTTRLQDPGSTPAIVNGTAASGPVPGSAPIGKTPEVRPTSATGDPGKTAVPALRTSGGSSSTTGASSASQTASDTKTSSEPFRSSQPPPDNVGQDSGSTVKSTASPRYQ